MPETEREIDREESSRQEAEGRKVTERVQGGTAQKGTGREVARCPQ